MALGAVGNIAIGSYPKLVDAAVGTGVTRSNTFSVPEQESGNGATLQVLPTIVTGAFTVLAVDLEASIDGGANFFKTGKTLNLFLSGVPVTGGTFTNVVPGLLYQLNVSGFTGGTNVTLVGTTG